MIKPMLCKLGTEEELKNLSNINWIFEPKLDGARIIAVVNSGAVRLFGRSGSEKTKLFPDLKIETHGDCILDGEVVSGNSFNDLQHRVNRQNGIAQAIQDYPARFSVFDILECQGVNVRNAVLAARKEFLRQMLTETDNVKMTSSARDGVALFELMKANSLEGVVGKSLTGLYHENSREWLKVKCWQEAAFVAVGYTAGTGWRTSTFGALVLADPQGNYVGSVGTGFNAEDIRNLVKMFSAGTCPFPREPEPAKWIKPFPVKIKFLEKTNQGQLRFPVFKGVGLKGKE